MKNRFKNNKRKKIAHEEDASTASPDFKDPILMEKWQHFQE